MEMQEEKKRMKKNKKRTWNPRTVEQLTCVIWIPEGEGEKEEIFEVIMTIF